MTRKLLAVVASLLLAGAAYAACTQHVYVVDGKMIICMTCCDSRGNCTTTCS